MAYLFPSSSLIGINIATGQEYLWRSLSKSAQGLRVLTIGDSITEGATLSNYIADAWPNILGRGFGTYYPTTDGLGSSGTLWTLTGTWTQFDQSVNTSGPALRTLQSLAANNKATITLDGSAADSIIKNKLFNTIEIVAANISGFGNINVDIFSGSSGGTVGTGNLYSATINCATGVTVLGYHFGPIPISNANGPVTIQINSDSSSQILFDGIITYNNDETASIVQQGIQFINLGNGGAATSDWNPSSAFTLIMDASGKNWDDSQGVRSSGTTTRRLSAVHYNIGANDWFNQTGSSTLSAGQVTTIIANIVATGTYYCNLLSKPSFIISIGWQPAASWCGTPAWNQCAAALTSAANQLISTFGSQIMLVDERAWNDYKAADDVTSPCYLNAWNGGTPGAGGGNAVHPDLNGHFEKALRYGLLYGVTPQIYRTPATVNNIPARVTGVGTAYNLTNSLAVVTFGTTSPSLSLAPGSYILIGGLSFSGGTVADNIQGQFYNSTASAAIGITHNDTVNLAIGTNIADMIMSEILTINAQSTITMRAQNATAARGTIIAANSYLTTIRIG